MRNKILLLASGEDQYKLLLQRLFGVTDDLKPLIHESNEVANLLMKSWTIDNKYYTADVEFWITTSTEALTTPVVSQGIEKHCEALLLVYDYENPSSFEPLQRWADSFVEKSPASIQLCVANTISNNSSDDGWSSHYADWCSENNFEYVVSDRLSSLAAAKQKGEQDEPRHSLLSNEGGIEGADRILEALESNMWENMVRKGAGAKNFGQISQPEVLQETLSKIESIDNSNSQGNDEKTAKKQFSEAAQAVEMLFQQFCPPSTSSDNKTTKTTNEDEYLSQLLHASLNTKENKFEDEDEEDDDFQALETMFLRMREMRNRASGLSDQERKEMAAKVALTFSQLLGDDD